MHLNRFGFIDDLLAAGMARGDEVLLDLGLPVHPYAAADEVDEVEMLPFAWRLQVDPAMLDTLAPQAVTQADRAKQLYR